MTDTELAADDNNLVWIDLEMTGLFPERDRIIEIAVVVTDPQLQVRIEGPVFAVHQSDAVLAGMDAWNTGTQYPWAFTREAVNAVGANTLTLRP